jgi:hypothetical protein
MQRRQLPDSRRSIHAYEAKYGQVMGHQCAVLRFAGGAYLGPVVTRTGLRRRGANVECGVQQIKSLDRSSCCSDVVPMPSMLDATVG